ncbi:unnamed protein product [Wuchereria bancrofti]|uniref:Uncharacterized protein n=1 Tax=Wuchereria bancrofti TaxID=6293 RepID=A0A3P7DRP0_WUCBA|nr:unnamed protein product [Wuchereria bancrofti]
MDQISDSAKTHHPGQCNSRPNAIIGLRYFLLFLEWKCLLLDTCKCVEYYMCSKCCSAFACTSTLAPGTASHSGLHLQSDSVPFDQCHSIDACLKTEPSFKRNSHGLQNEKSLVMKNFPEYPENDKFRIPRENSEKHPEKRNLAQSISRKEFYVRENEVKMARNTGIGIGDEKMETYLMNALLSKSPDGSTLNGMNIAVFDLHSRRFVERLLNAGVSSLSIIETSQCEAQKAKVRFLFWF